MNTTEATRWNAHMRRAFDLASRGPATGANPQVGCVIVGSDGVLLAEGFHLGAGTKHAERDALAKLEPGAARGSTAVVSLEPCNHVGRTGPCVDALIEAGVARVVYSVSDPGVRSSGGAARLAREGVEIVDGVLVDEGERLIDEWLTTAKRGRPHVTIKWASSLDGRAAAADRTSQWITGPAARADVHVERSRADAIFVGAGTLLADDPSLTARVSDTLLHDTQPLPVVVGHRAVPESAAIRRHPRGFVQIPGDDLASELAGLLTSGVRRVFVEGGPRLASALIREGLADTLITYLAPTLLGGDQLALRDLGVSTIATAQRFEFSTVERVGADIKLVATRKETA